jgi:hypothetical protein
MNRIRPRTTVLSGAAIGLIAGAALYGAVSSSAEATTPTAFTVAKAPVASAPASAARCATGQKLENGVCIIHVVRTVVVPAAGSALNPTSGPSESSSRATEPADHEGASQAEHENAAEQAKDALEHTSEAAELAAANRD